MTRNKILMRVCALLFGLVATHVILSELHLTRECHRFCTDSGSSDECYLRRTAVLVYDDDVASHEMSFSQNTHPRISAFDYASEVATGRYFDINCQVSRYWPRVSTLPRRNSCAIVGNSGILLGSHCGNVIDGHDYIIRANLAPIRGYTRDVGERASLTIVNFETLFYASRNLTQTPPSSHWRDAYIDRLRYLNDSTLWFSKSTLVRNSSFYLRNLVRVAKDEYKLPVQIAYSWRPVHIETYYKLRHYATTGFNTVIIAKTFCDHVTLYGFYPSTQDDNGFHVPHHYYEDVAYEYKNQVHDFQQEFKKLKEMEEMGEVTIVTDVCPGGARKRITEHVNKEGLTDTKYVFKLDSEKLKEIFQVSNDAEAGRNIMERQETAVGGNVEETRKDEIRKLSDANGLSYTGEGENVKKLETRKGEVLADINAGASESVEKLKLNDGADVEETRKGEVSANENGLVYAGASESVEKLKINNKVNVEDIRKDEVFADVNGLVYAGANEPVEGRRINKGLNVEESREGEQLADVNGVRYAGASESVKNPKINGGLYVEETKKGEELADVNGLSNAGASEPVEKQKINDGLNVEETRKGEVFPDANGLVYAGASENVGEQKIDDGIDVEEAKKGLELADVTSTVRKTGEEVDDNVISGRFGMYEIGKQRNDADTQTLIGSGNTHETLDRVISPAKIAASVAINHYANNGFYVNTNRGKHNEPRNDQKQRVHGGEDDVFEEALKMYPGANEKTSETHPDILRSPLDRDDTLRNYRTEPRDEERTHIDNPEDVIKSPPSLTLDDIFENVYRQQW